MNSDNEYRKLIEQEVLGLIEEHLEEEVEMDTQLRDYFDELDVLELFMAIEEEFDVEISPLDEELIETPADFVDFICKQNLSHH